MTQTTHFFGSHIMQDIYYVVAASGVIIALFVFNSVTPFSQMLYDITNFASESAHFLASPAR